MKPLLLLFVLLTACGGRLSDEQRRKLREGMELNTIRKVSDAELTEAAFALGRSVSEAIDNIPIGDRRRIDSVEGHYHVRIRALQAGDSLLLALEKQLVEAYTSSAGQVSDDVQRLGADSLLYTKPVMKSTPDGAMEFRYALGIRLPVREVVLSIR
jgi:hypothetical protein